MARPLNDRDKQEDPPNDADISVAGGMQLFAEIEANEQALIATVSKSLVTREDASLILDRVAEVSSLVLALPWAMAPPLYGILHEYKAVLADANHSIEESGTMMRTEAKDLHDILASFEAIFKATSAPGKLMEYVPTAGANQRVSLSMFQYAHGVVITGSQINNQYVVHTVNDDSRKHSDKILRRLNCLIAIVLF